MENKLIDLVKDITKNDKSGHGIDHIFRVYKLALKFAQLENANKEIIMFASLLHDVDDYKIVGN